MESKVKQAEAKVAEQKSQFWLRMFEAVARFFEMIALVFMGRRSRKSLSTSAGAAMRERGQQSRSRPARRGPQGARRFAAEQADLDALDAELHPDRIVLEKVEVAPRKSDVAVDEVLLAWTPWWISPSTGEARVAY